MTDVYSLPFSDREGQTLWRALVQYETSLKFSSIRDSAVVAEELQACRELQERVSLQTYAKTEASDDKDA